MTDQYIIGSSTAFTEIPSYATQVEVSFDGEVWIPSDGGEYERYPVPDTKTINISDLGYDGEFYYLNLSDLVGSNYSTGAWDVDYQVRWVDASGNKSPWSVTNNWFFACLTGDTLITMSDGKKKRLKDLKKGDKVLGVDPETGELVATEVTATDTDEVKFKDEYTIWYLSDGTKIKTVNKHRFYNVREKKMMFMEEWQIGDEFVKEDGTKVKLEKKRTIHRRVRHFTLNTTTETYFANGMLSGNYHTKPMASETFKFMK